MHTAVLASQPLQRNSRIFLGLCFDSAGLSGYHGALMSQQLPEQIDPFRLARQRRVLSGQIDVVRMKRLAPLLYSSEGAARVELEFGVDTDLHVQYMRGNVSVDLQMSCQRCLQPMTQHVEATIALGLVTTQRQSDEMPTHYEPLLVENDTVFLVDVIEDELLLALPIVAVHPPEACAAQVATSDDAPEPRRENPFAKLAQLKSRTSGKG